MRLAVTLFAILLGLLVAFGAFYNASSRNNPPAQPPTAATPANPASPGANALPASPDASATPVEAGAQPTPAGPAAPTPASIPGLRALPAESPGEAVLGSVDPTSGYQVRVRLLRYGAGVQDVALSDFHETVARAVPYTVHDTLVAPRPGMPGAEYRVYPFAAKSITVNGTTVGLEAAEWSLVGSTGAEATYRLVIGDADGRPVVELERRFIVAKDSYDFRLEQRAINRSDAPVQVAWEQYLQGDMPADSDAYLGDLRMFATGYFHPSYDPARTKIFTEDGFVARSSLLGNPTIWPNPDLPGRELAWLASENRYFTVVTHSVVPVKLPNGADPRTPDIAPLERTFPRVGTLVLPPAAPSEMPRAVVFTGTTAATMLDPGGEAEFPIAVFAGPRESELFAQAPYSLLNLDELIRYELSCAWCTFQWLARGLLWLLEAFHYVVRDWGIAIILLVLIVRLILHPITKKAQVNMMKMGKQMQSIQPEVEKLKKKFGDDKARLQQETMKLYREKNINPANMLGCLPLLLQTPIWIALYAMLYFAIELRHQPAFYGVFQSVQMGAGPWAFLADLSSPDRFLQFGTGFRIPLPFVNNTINGVNLLPILMGVVFYFNMKFTTPPPPTGELTEQQQMMQQQQKMMRIIFPFMMPIFLYSAPSGLTLYICASTFAGIIDSYIVRKHVRDQEASGKLFESKPVKPGSIRDRVQKFIERKQVEMFEKQQDLQNKADKGGSGGFDRKRRK